VFNENIELSNTDYIPKKKFEIDSEDYLQDLQGLKYLNNKIYEIIPIKQRSFGMVVEKTKKEYDGYAIKNEVMQFNKRTTKSKPNEGHIKNYSKSTYRYNNDVDIFKKWEDEEYDRYDLVNNFLRDVEFNELREIIFNEERMKYNYAQYVKANEEEKKNKKKKAEKKPPPIDKPKKPKKIKKPKNQVVDQKINIESIIKYDQDNEVKLYCEWSGDNIVVDYQNEDSYDKTNELLAKLATINAIVWREGYNIIY